MSKSFLVYSSKDEPKPGKKFGFAKSIITLLSVFVLITFGWWANEFYQKNLKKEFGNLDVPLVKPLEKYELEKLSQTEIKPVKVRLEKQTKETRKYTTHLFSFEFDPRLQYKSILGRDVKKVTGLMNMPVKSSQSPIVILIRGYVDQGIYTSGMGSRRVGEFLAENGYVTIAPDFLGYAGSDSESGNIFETRFQTYTTVLTLLKSINQENFPWWDGKNIFIWAHSNGGQIALTTLEVAQAEYPTALWAPVTKAFPYSVLYYTDESADGGKFIRRELAKFEENYDVDKFSMTNYLDRIKAPIVFHLGTGDDAIPVKWTDGFVKLLKNKGKDVSYVKHPEADHDMNPLWNEAIKQTLEFFNSKLKS